MNYPPQQFDPGLQPSQIPYAVPEKRFPWGCLLGGCLGVILLIMAGTGIAVYSAYRFYTAQVAKYTSDSQIELPTVNITDDEIAAIEGRVKQFQKDFEKGSAENQLVLTADDINALIAKQKELRGKVYVSIVDGDIKAEVSIPADAIPGGKGRFFNGSVKAHVELKEGVLIVQVTEAEANGSPIPESIMEGIRKENLAKEIYKDAEVAKTLQRFESLVIDDDRIILTTHKKPDESEKPENQSGQNLPTDKEQAPAPDLPAEDDC